MAFLPLAFLPGYVVSWILKKLNLLRVPPEVELEGLDLAEFGQDFYPEFERVPEIIIEPDGREVDGAPVLLDAYWQTNGRADDPGRHRREELGDVRRVPVRRVERGHRRVLDVRRRGLDRHVHHDRARRRRSMIIAFIGFVVLEKQKLARQAAMLRASGALERPAVVVTTVITLGLGGEESRWPTSRSTSRRCRRRSRWLAPFMLGLSLLCIVVVVIILLSDLDGPFIGPWG